MQQSTINPALSNFSQVPNEAQIRLQVVKQKSKTTKRSFKDNSTYNQRLKLLDWLFEKSSITTAQAREYLDIMSPAPRILELRKAGYLIQTWPDTWTSEHGINHKGVARYVLTQKEPIERDNNGEIA